MNKFLYLILSLTLVACSSSGNKRTAELYKNLESESTLSDIVTKYGKRTYEWKKTDGSVVYNYQYSTSSYDALSYFPILFYFGKVTGETYNVNIIVDKNNKIQDRKGWFATYKTGNGSGRCGQGGSSCTQVLSRESK